MLKSAEGQNRWIKIKGIYSLFRWVFVELKNCKERFPRVKWNWVKQMCEFLFLAQIGVYIEIWRKHFILFRFSINLRIKILKLLAVNSEFFIWLIQIFCWIICYFFGRKVYNHKFSASINWTFWIEKFEIQCFKDSNNF